MTTKEQIMREAGSRLHSIFEDVIPMLLPGATLSDIDNKVGTLLKSMGARSALKMMGLPGNMSISIDKQVIQGTPDERTIGEGDLVSIDMTLYYKGFFVDKATTIVVEPKHYEKTYLVNAANSCLQTGIQVIRPGMKAWEIGSLIETQANLLRMRIGKEFFGHTIGESHHLKPLIPNFNNSSEDIIADGSFVAVEPIVFYDYYVLRYKDQEVWADVLSAHAEETILVKDGGAEVIT